MARLGERPAASITDDDVFAGLEDLAAAPSRRYAWRDIDGKKIYRAREKPRSGSTLNRYQVALAALFSWGIRRRRLPRGFENPCRKVERRREPAGVVRFLSSNEREQLLEAGALEHGCPQPGAAIRPARSIATLWTRASP